MRLLGRGELTAKVAIEVAGATKSAVAAVEKAGGTVTIRGDAVAQKQRKGDAGADEPAAKD